MAFTLTTKSQVTLPKAIREHLKIAPGDAVTFRIVADGGVRVEPVTPHDGAKNRVQTQALAAARKRFSALAGSGLVLGPGGTDAFMHLLRGYDEDTRDPGFKKAAAGAAIKPRSASKPGDRQ